MELVDVAGEAPLDQPLQLQLQVGQHVGVDQLSQLLGAEEVAEQVAVEGQGGARRCSKRHVTGVHVDGDPAEHQRLGER